LSDNISLQQFKCVSGVVMIFPYSANYLNLFESCQSMWPLESQLHIGCRGGLVVAMSWVRI